MMTTDSIVSVISSAASTDGKSPSAASRSSSSNDLHRLSSSSHANDSCSSLSKMDTTDSDHASQSHHFQSTDQGKLSSEDFVELTRISRKKEDIEHHIANLKSWSSWDPFRNVSSYSPDADALQRSKETLAELSNDLRCRQIKCSRLEDDVQHFNVQDMKRLRTVAKAVSKRHLSGPDTDLLELALETVYALDKLLRLLREQRTLHDLTELRLRWELMLCSSWEDVIVLRQDIHTFEHKCKALLSSRDEPDNGSALDENGTQKFEKAETTEDKPSASRTRRAASLTQSSSRLAAESIKLESARLILRIRSFDSEKVRPAGKLLDLLIDQRQVPERMIDEQEKLEDALPQPSAIEATSLQVTTILGLVTAPASGHTETASSPIQDVMAPSPASSNRIGDDSGTYASSTWNRPKGRVPGRQSPRNAITPSRSRKTSTSSMLATPVRQASNRYRPDPRDVLDVAIGNIVNRLPMSVSIRSAKFGEGSLTARSGKGDDLSGQYWIGEPDPRLCFCRILPSSMVMVRVGGGWQELLEFLTQHYTHLSARGWNSDADMLNAITGKPGSNHSWLRSASGPVDSPRLRSKSSFASLQSREPTRLLTPQQPSRIVTMPMMTTSRNKTPSKNHASHRIPYAAPAQENAADLGDQTMHTPSRTPTLPSSGSKSSIIIHSPSPS